MTVHGCTWHTAALASILALALTIERPFKSGSVCLLEISSN